MALLTFHQARLVLANQILLDNADWQIDPRERIALVGRNGAGKSTFLKVIAGQIHLDAGKLIQTQGIKVAMLAQEVPENVEGPVFNYLVQNLGDVGQFLIQIRNPNLHPDELTRVHIALDECHGFEHLANIESMASRLGISLSDEMQNLSGGMKRRVLLGAALLAKPDLLLLDEPTNHLDLPSIEWLEGILKSYTGALLFITHDRAFLKSVATGIVELDRGKLYQYPADYETFLERREERREVERRENALFDKRLSQEETWIRTGIKARRTRNEGRVRALKALRKAYSERRLEMGKMKSVGLDVSQSGMLVLEASALQFSYENKPIVKDLSLLITRGDKLAIIGANGCGKTTLLKLLLGELAPNSGSVRLGTGLKIAYFDQLRNQLNHQASVMDNVADGATHVTIQGRNIHVASYLQDFLFSPDKFNQPVSTLSGGERNRLLLAKLFAHPVNLLVMDEPTNDLDIETLEMLESMLADYPGTLILISHDRAFVDEVATSVLVNEGPGIFVESLGGYSDYQSHIREKSVKQEKIEVKPKRQTVKLSYNEQRELQNLPLKIEVLEQEINTLQEAMAMPDFYQQSQEKVALQSKVLQDKEAELQLLYGRWETLEEKS